MQFSVTILGSSSALPTSERFSTAQIVNCYGRSYLLDCCEGAQIQVRKYKQSFQRIDRIFISHMHGDHFLGLPGLLSTMDLLGRKKEIHIHAFDDLRHFLDGYTKTGNRPYGFPIRLHPMSEKEPELLFENDHITIQSFPVTHSIPCCGFVIKEKLKGRRLKKSFVEKYQPTIPEIHQIKAGGDFTLKDGTILKNIEVTDPPPHTRTYSFVTDTAFDESIIPFIQNSDVLYHEATFAKEMQARAKQTKHSTAEQAAQMAKLSSANKLLIGHYSVRYRDIKALLNEAQEVFPNTVCAKEGMVINL